MRYFTREYIKKSLNILEDGLFVINERAKAKDDMFYREVYQETYDNYCKAWNYQLTEDEFMDVLNNKMEFKRNALPEDIIHKIADFRIASMGIVTSDIYHEIMAYNDEMIHYCENARSCYRNEFNQSNTFFSDKCRAAINCDLSDAKIIKYEQFKDCLSLYFSLDTYTKDNDYDLVYMFKKGAFKELPRVLEKDALLAYELYASENFVEFHILCMDSQCIITAEALDYAYSESYKIREGIDL